MQTTNKTAAAGCILAIDLGIFKSVACLYPTTAEAEIRYTTWSTTKEELAELLERLKPSVLVIEACALAGWVYDLSVERGRRPSTIRVSGLGPLGSSRHGTPSRSVAQLPNDLGRDRHRRQLAQGEQLGPS
jgi:hypothetical protein